MKRYWFCCGLAAVGLVSQSAAEAQVNYQTTQTSAPIITPISAPKTTPTPIGGGTVTNCDSGCDSNADGCSTGGCSDSVGSFRTLGNEGFFRRGGGLLGGGLLGGGLLGGIIKPSDHCFDDFISPMTNPTHFEDPRNLTEARFIYMRHKVPQAAAGGEINLFALQLRAAITDRLSVIATKDGYITSTNPLVDDGWADVAAGLKYNLLRDPAGQGLLSIGGTYELSNGSTRSLQGNGDGVFNFFVSGAQKLTDRANYIGAFGVRLPNDTAAETSMMFWSHHVDRRVTERLYLLAEANWFHWMDSGAGGIPGVEGGDLFNFGSTNVTGNDIVTTAVGAKFKPSRHQELGVAIEFPVTDRRDVLDNRLTFDWIIRY